MADVKRTSASSTAVSTKSEERRTLYNRTVRRAELRAILLSELQFKVNREVKITDRPKAFYGVGDISNFSFDADRGACAARVVWKIELKVSRRSFAKCIAKYDAIYDGFECDEEIARLFIENVARSATYSYFRAMYASLDWGAEIRSPPLPVIKFQPKV